MSDVTGRPEVLRRISMGELPTAADFVVVQACAGDGVCKGCGAKLSAGEPRCVIDSVTAGLGPFPMHADCFLAWGEASLGMGAHRDGSRRADGATEVSPLDGLAVAWHTSQRETFCQTRLEMLNNRVRNASEFAEAVRRMRKSGAPAAWTACAQARRRALLARDAYDEHVKDHCC